MSREPVDPRGAAGPSLRRRVHALLEPSERDRAGQWVDGLILTLISLNVLALVLETVEPVRQQAPAFFYWFEVVSVLVFSVEYVLRLWSVTAEPRYAHPVRGRLRYARTPLLVIDLLAIVPFYLPFVGIDLRMLRAARLVRVVRMAKLTRYSRALQTIGRVVRETREELVTVLVLLALLLLVASSLMYFAEHRAQPEAFASIPAAMWWGINTITTVGYGDVLPVTALGRIIAGLISIVGIGMIALPTGIVGSAFMREIGRRGGEASAVCPHCGCDVRVGRG